MASLLQQLIDAQRAARSIKDIAMAEGVPATFNTPYVGALAAGAINTSLGAMNLPVNHAMWAENYVFSCRSPKALECQIELSAPGTTGIQGTGTDVFRFCIGPTGTYTHRIEALLTNNEAGGRLMQAAVRQVINADGTADTTTGIAANALSLYGSLSGRLLYDDQNFGAKKIIKYVQDSLGNGVGRTTKANCLDWKIRQYYAERRLNAVSGLTRAGLDVRGVMKAVSGSTTTMHEGWRLAGWHDEPQIDLLVYQLGANDASQSVSDTVFGNNLSAFIAFKRDRYPNAKMLVIGTHPLENATAEGFAALHRTKAAAIIAATGDANIKFCNLGLLGAAFSSVTANYAATDTPGSRIHPSDIGDNLFWVGNGGTFSGVRAFLDANIPTI